MRISLSLKQIVLGTIVSLVLSTIIYKKFYTVKEGPVDSVNDREGLLQRSHEIANMEFRKTRDLKMEAIPKERMMDAYHYRNEMRDKQLPGGSLAAAPLAGVTWNERGPTNVSGRIRAILVDANDATGNTVLAGGVGGGVWRTTNALAANPTWSNIDDFFDNLAVVSIAQDPSNLDNIYFGTGEGFFNADAIQGLGIWKSTDRGLSFTQLASTNNSSFFWVNDIEIAGNGDVFAATRTAGVQFSDDGGTTWTNTLTSANATVLISGNMAFPGLRYGDIEIASDGDIYAMGGIGTTDGIYRSTDGGVNWTFLNIGTNGLRTNGFQRIEMAIAPNNSERLYALFESSANASCDSIVTSTDGGNNWTPGTVPMINDQNNFPEFTRRQAWYDLIAAVDPNDETRVFIGGVDPLVSDDAGSTWTQIARWHNLMSINVQIVHADHHEILFLPGSSDTMYWGNDGGFYTSLDGSTNPTPTITFKSNNLNLTQFYSCDINPNAGSNIYIGGTQDNGTQRFTNPGLSTTVEVVGGDGGFSHIDYDETNIEISSTTFSRYRITNDNWGTTTSVTFPRLGNPNGMFINPTDYDWQNNVLFGSYRTQWYNMVTDVGNTNVQDSGRVAQIPFGDIISAVKVSPNINDRVYFGTDNGTIVYVDGASMAAGGNIIGTNISPPGGGYVSNIEIEPGNENHILMTFSNYGINSVWESMDGGTSWTSIEGNLPDMPIRWIVLYPGGSTLALVGTELGVWSTDFINGAATVWGPTNGGLANTRVDMVCVRPSDRTLLAATHGRGMFSTQLPPLTALALSKTFDSLVTDPSGLSQVHFTIYACNRGTDTLNNIMVMDSFPLIPQLCNNVLTGFGTIEDSDGTFTSISAVDAPNIKFTFEGDGMAPGDCDTLSFYVVYQPDPSTMNYENYAIGSAVGAITGLTVSDSSNTGTIPYIDSVSATTFINAAIAVTKWVDTSYLVMTPPDSVGNFLVTYKIKLVNTGNTLLGNVTLADDLDNPNLLGSGYMLSAGLPSFTVDHPAAPPNINPGFDGVTDDSIFRFSDNVFLPTGDSIVLCMSIMVNPNATTPVPAPDTLFNQVIVNGRNGFFPSVVSDTSDNGMQVLSDNGTGTCNDPTPLNLVDINISKQILSVRPFYQDSFPGDALAEFQLLVKNKGDVPIYDIMVNDPIQTQLGAVFLEIINDPALVSPPEIINGAPIAVNPATVSPTAMPFPKVIDGSAEDDTLNRDEFIDIRYSLRLDPNIIASPDYRILTNQADAMGESMIGPTADSSDTGFDPESSNADAVGNTGGEDDPTLVTLPMIGLAKEITKVREPASGTEGNFDAIFHVHVENTGNTPLDSIFLYEDLATQYGIYFVGPVSVNYLVNTATAAPPINPGWIGAAPNHSLTLATPTTQVLPGQNFILEVIVEINPSAGGVLCDSLYNVVIAEARGEEFDGTPLEDAFNMPIITYDTSDAGTDPEGFNPDDFADRGFANDSTIIPDCWKNCDPSLADLIHLSMDENCEVELDPGLFLNGVSRLCIDLCFWRITSIKDEWGRDVPNPVPAEYVGQTLTVTLYNIVCRNPGWSQVKIEDKYASILTCGDQMLNCWDAEEFLAAIPTEDACGYGLEFEEKHRIWVDFDCEDPDYIGYVQRSVISTDVWGNTNRCDSQRIYIIRENLADLVCPDDPIEIECCSTHIVDGEPVYVLWDPDYVYEDEDGYSHPIPFRGGLVEPPYISTTQGPHYIGSSQNSEGGVNNGKCNIIAEYKDHVLPTCGSTYKIRREWKIYDWCTGEDTMCIQWIKILDTIGPEVDGEYGKPICLDGGQDGRCVNPIIGYDISPYDECRLPRIFAVKPHECVAHVDIVYPSIINECGLKFAKGDEGKIAEALSKIKVVYTIRYEDPSHPGKEIVLHDEIGPDGDVVYLPGGWYQVIYYITDGCWNETYACEFIAVEDNVAPTPVCDEITQVTLDPDSCWVRVYAQDLDDGSNDNCAENLHFAVAHMDTIEYYRTYWHGALLDCYGEYDYNHYKYYIDELIEDWINCYVFNDYVDLYECGRDMLVMRVYEADGFPVYDKHTFVGSKHQWFCFNLYDDYACFFKYHYDEFAHYQNPRADLCDYEFGNGLVEFKGGDCGGRLIPAYHKLLYDPYCQCREVNMDEVEVDNCYECEPIQILIGGPDLNVAENRIGIRGGFLHGPSPNRACCLYESESATSEQAEKWWYLVNKYPELAHLDCKRYQFAHLYNDCMIEVIKDDKEAPVCKAPADFTIYCDGVPISGSFFPNGGNDEVEWSEARYAHQICREGDVFTTGCEFDRTDDEANVYDSPDNWCVEIPWDRGPTGYYGGPTNVGYAYTDYGDCNPEIDQYVSNWQPMYCRFWLMLDAYDLSTGASAQDGETGKPDPTQYFGSPDIYDNCKDLAVDSTTIGDIDECGVGVYIRTWTVSDGCGNASSCTQRVWVLPRSDFEVKFPADVVVDCSVDTMTLSPVKGTVGYPLVSDDECELVGITYSDQQLTSEGDGCYKILRTWKVIDWCTYNPERHDRHEDVIVDDRCVAGVDRPCVIRQLKDDGDGLITYLQVIKVIDREAPVVLCNAPDTFCLSADQAGVDDEDCSMVFVDYLIGEAFDTCNTSINYRYTVDPEGNSDEALWIYGQGNQLQEDLPVGTHTVTLYAMDGCGNESSCETQVTVQDCKAPLVYCHGGIVTVLMNSNNELVIWAKDFDGGSTDNCSSKENLRFTFSALAPENDLNFDSIQQSSFTSYDCDQLGLNNVEIYVWDEEGNYNYCQVSILIQKGSSTCDQVLQSTLGNSKGEILIEISKKKPATKWLSIGEQNKLIEESKIALLQNVPNPFANETAIGFFLPKSSMAEIQIFDLNGRMLRSYKGQYTTGYHEVVLKTYTLLFKEKSSVLYYKLVTDYDQSPMNKMILIQ